MFFNWWLQQLSELLPRNMRAPASRQADAVILDIDRDSVAMVSRKQGQILRLRKARIDESGFGELAGALAAHDQAPRLQVLRFPSSMFLQKRVSFPASARRNLSTLLGFEMDRETPFNLDEIYWNYRAIRPNFSNGRLDVDLVVVPRLHVDPFIDMACRAGFQPDGIEVETGSGETILLRTGTGRRWRIPQIDRPLIGLAATAAVLLILAVAIPFIRQQWALASTDRTLKSLMAEAHQVAALRQSADQMADAVSLINKERDRGGSVVGALAVTTRLIPLDSHLTALSIHGGRLTMSGLSPSAAHLIDLLSQSPAFREPAFDSAVVQSDRSGLETFTISATFTRARGS